MEEKQSFDDINFPSGKTATSGTNFPRGKTETSGTNFSSGKTATSDTNFPSGKTATSGTNFPSGKTATSGTNFPKGKVDIVPVSSDHCVITGLKNGIGNILVEILVGLIVAKELTEATGTTYKYYG